MAHVATKRIAPIVLLALSLAPSASAARSELDAFRARHGQEWVVTPDARTSRPRRLAGGSVPIGSLVSDVTSFLASAAPLLDLDPNLLRLREPGPVVATGGLVALHFDWAPGGVPIEGADVSVIVSHGRVIAVHSVGIAAVSASPVPRVPAEDAFTVALAASGFARDEVVASTPRLAFLPRDAGHVLAWGVTLAREREGTRHVAWIDAQSGTLLALSDETLAQCAPVPPGGTERRVVGGVRTQRADAAERRETFASVTIGSGVTDAAGLFVPQAGDARLEGPVARVECVDCTLPESPLAPQGPTGDADFGEGGVDGDGNGLATPADRTAYFHVERVHRQATRWLALPWLGQPVAVRTNLPNTCNAYWNGIALNFFRSSAACSNTGEIRDVVSHEWGHGLDENDGLPPPGVTVDAATGEAVADVVANLRSRDSCVGESFFVDPSDWPSTACSGVRDVDEHAPGQRRGVLSSSNVVATCPASAHYRGVAGREGHCEGEILGQAFWHLVRTLSTGTSYGDGRPLATGLGDELAWQVAEALFYRSRPLMASYAPSDAQSIGMSAHEALLLADDEGDGLASGTPHAWAIDDAFAHHGIAESPLPAPTSAPCGRTAPAVGATSMLDATSGQPFVRVDWTDAGAAGYDVLRDDADGAGLQPFGGAFGPGAGVADDRGILPGRTPRYAVVALWPDGCQAVAAATPTSLPALRVDAARIDDSVTGNGDGRMSAGETVDVFVDLANDGSADATAVVVTLDDVDPALAIVAGGPVAYGRIAAGSVVAGPSAFRVRASVGAPSSVALGIAAESGEGCLRATALLRVARPELEQAGIVVDDSGGDADGALDPSEAVALVVRLRNVGDEDALVVTGTLSFRSVPPPGVTITRAGAAWPDIAASAEEDSSAPSFGISATAGVTRGTLVRLDVALQVGGAPHRTLPVDLVVGGVASGLLDWEAAISSFPPAHSREIVNQAIVIQASDDDGDGAITGCDVPDVVIETWEVTATDEIIVVSGDDGHLLHQFPVTPCRSGWSIFQSLAAADIDGDGAPEILSDDDGRVCAFELDGTLLWKTPSRVWWPEFTPGRCAAAPQIWDLDGDGTAEVIVGSAILDGATGAVIHSDVSRRDSGRSLVGDLDLDGVIDVVSYHGEVRHGDGSLVGTMFPGFWQHGGIVNLDADPQAEVVYMAMVDQPAPSLVAREHDGALKWEWPGEAGHDLRPAPCFGDFDGDGLAETALPAGSEMILFDDDGSIEWRLPMNDVSGAAGCSVFDFDEDGRPEIMIRDESRLQVIQGSSGVVLWSVPCRSPTHYECPIVADVDADGSAEILIHETAGGNQSTLRCYGNPAWPPARGVWNQEAYAVSHVSESGVATTSPAPRWLTGNDYRGQAIACPCSDAMVSVDVDLPCDAAVACLQATITGGVAPFALSWDFGDGSPPSSDLAPCHEYPGAGTFVGRVTLTDDFACRASSAFVVVVAEPLVVTLTGTPTCPGETCFHADVSGGTLPVEIEWSFEGADPVASGVDECHDFAGTTWSVRVLVRDARGCLADADAGGLLGDPPESVGAALRVRDHSDAYGAMIDATLDWSLDEGLPRPPGDTYLLLRATTPVGLLPIPGTDDYAPMTYRDSTAAGVALPHVHYYVLLAKSECGALSAD